MRSAGQQCVSPLAALATLRAHGSQGLSSPSSRSCQPFDRLGRCWPRITSEQDAATSDPAPRPARESVSPRSSWRCRACRVGRSLRKPLRRPENCCAGLASSERGRASLNGRAARSDDVAGRSSFRDVTACSAAFPSRTPDTAVERRGDLRIVVRRRAAPVMRSPEGAVRSVPTRAAKPESGRIDSSRRVRAL